MDVVAPSAFFALCVWLIFHWTLFKQNIKWKWIFSPVLFFGLAAWFSLVVFLSQLDFFVINPILAPNIFFGWLIIFEFFRRLLSSQKTQKFFTAVPIFWLIMVQSYRIVGIGFFNFYAKGLLPALFVFPSGIGDVFIGITAPFVAVIYLLKKKFSKEIAIWWNVLGIIDLIIAISVGFLAFSRPVQFIRTEVSTEAIALFPLAVVPLFAVPIAFFLHIICFKNLKGRA